MHINRNISRVLAAAVASGGFFVAPAPVYATQLSCSSFSATPDSSGNITVSCVDAGSAPPPSNCSISVSPTTISAMSDLGSAAADLAAWLGPAIGPARFEVGADVRDRFCDGDPDAHAAFAPHAPGKWLADLDALARMRLARAGVRRVSGGGFCTHSDAARFFSYRRERNTGRMATAIWLTTT